MIVLDTNVVAETMRPQPDPSVMAWLDNQPSESLYTTAIAEAEIRYGIAILPEGERRNRLAAGADQAFTSLLAERVLPFDRDAAGAYAEIAGRARAKGTPMSMADCQIAAITLSQNARLATRNERDFSNARIALINPWEAPTH